MYKTHHKAVKAVFKQLRAYDKTDLLGGDDRACEMLDKIYRRRLAEIIYELDPKGASATLNILRQRVSEL